MPDQQQYRELLQRIAADVLREQGTELAAEIARRAADQIPAPEPVACAPAASADWIGLNAAVLAVASRTTQGEVLSSLLDAAAQFSGRALLFVMRGGFAVGWQARGIFDEEAVRSFTLDMSNSLIARVFQKAVAMSATSAEFDGNLTQKFGAPVEDTIAVVPLVVRDKVAALLYADSGTPDAKPLDYAGLELLSRYAALWLEVLALRKSLGETPAHAAALAAANVDAATAPAWPAKSRQAPIPQGTVLSPAVVEEKPPLPPASVSGAPLSLVAGGGHDDDLHRRARRFAKLLIDEIKLYNQAKVAEGRTRHDLYARLRDDIDKSRSSYQTRYGQAIGSMEYFQEELVRNLANNDVALLGEDFALQSR